MDQGRAIGAEIAGEEPRRRSCVGCLFTSSIGCGAFFFGSILAAALFAPRMLSGPAASLLQSLVNDSIDGELSIETLELSWTERQRVEGVTLVDARGVDVLELDGYLPSLQDLLDEGPTRWQFRTRVKLARIVIDADGVSNLARALGEGGVPLDLATLEEHVRLGARTHELRTDLTAVTVTDARTGIEWTVPEGDLRLVHSRDRLQEIELSAKVVHLDREGSLECEARLDLAGNVPSEIIASLSAEALPAAVVDSVLTGSIPARFFEEAFGGALEVEAKLEGDLRDLAHFELSLTPTVAERSGETELGVDWHGSVAGGYLTLEDGAFDATLRVPPRLFEERVAAAFAGDLEIARVSGEPWRLHARSLVVDLGLRGPRAETDGQPLPGFVAELEPGCSFTIVAPGAEEPLVFGDVAATLDGRRGERLRIDLDGRIVDGGSPDGSSAAGRAGGLHLTLQSADPLEELLRRIRAGEQPQIAERLDLEGKAVPASVLDAFGVPSGWVADLFGPHVDVVLAGSGATRAEMRSGARRALSGARLVQDTLRSEPDGFIDLELPLDEALRNRLLKPLLPWLEDLETTEAGRHVLVRVESFELPLDGDASQLSARLRIELGEVRFRYHQGLWEHFEEEGEDELRQWKLLPIVLDIDRGVVRYEYFALPLAGDECELSGTLDLVSDEIHVTAEVPMRAVGRQLGIEGSMADLLLENDVLTSVGLEGPWDRPKVMVDVEEVKKIMQNKFVQELALPALMRAAEAMGD
ncbi:MAG: hypothetical protein GY711_32020 [bacterium]|nr:hypothetical protein [bacterium]